MDKNIKIDESENYVLLSINPKIYSLDVIYTVAYVFLEKLYLLLDGDAKKEVTIKLTAKEKLNKEELEKLGKEFLNQLISYGFHKKQSEKNNSIRQIILQRALLTGAEANNDDIEEPGIGNDLEEDFEDIEDPEEIAVPWEEKYGEKNDS